MVDRKGILGLDQTGGLNAGPRCSPDKIIVLESFPQYYPARIEGMPDQQIGVAAEYQSLRQELLDSKKYVFERPLAIAALAAAGIQYYGKPLHIVLPLAVALLTLFNFWFTVNRLLSAGCPTLSASNYFESGCPILFHLLEKGGVRKRHNPRSVSRVTDLSLCIP